MDDKDVAQIAVSAVGGGTVWHFLRILLGYFRARSEKDGQIVDKTLAYADSLRADIESMRREFREESTRRDAEVVDLKNEIAKLRTELSEAHETIRMLYEQSVSHQRVCGRLPA